MESSIIRWTMVSDKEPPVGKNIMIFSEEAGVAEGVYLGDGEYKQFRWNSKVNATYWAPMPVMDVEEVLDRRTVDKCLEAIQWAYAKSTMHG